jgi:hypothetical protein
MSRRSASFTKGLKSLLPASSWAMASTSGSRDRTTDGVSGPGERRVFCSGRIRTFACKRDVSLGFVFLPTRKRHVSYYGAYYDTLFRDDATHDIPVLLLTGTKLDRNPYFIYHAYTLVHPRLGFSE